jgi:hypothetical protein
MGWLSNGMLQGLHQQQQQHAAAAAALPGGSSQCASISHAERITFAGHSISESCSVSFASAVKCWEAGTHADQ